MNSRRHNECRTRAEYSTISDWRGRTSGTNKVDKNVVLYLITPPAQDYSEVKALVEIFVKMLAHAGRQQGITILISDVP